jgi:hypothetical protein
MGDISNFMELWISRGNTITRCVGCRIFVDIVYNYPITFIKILAKK